MTYNKVIASATGGEVVELSNDEISQRQQEVSAAQILFQNQIMIDQISELESQITPRRMRDALLGDMQAIAFIQGIEDQIQEIRDQLSE